MNVKIKDVMVDNVITAQPHHTVSHVLAMMDNNGINSVPVVGPEDALLGIVSLADLAHGAKDGAPISQHMTENVYSVPAYNDVHVAARVMRNHKIHHVVVTHENKVVGMVSSFDLLRLVEDHRFVMKQPPQPSKKKNART